ncbi:carboxypeptidase M32, partial [Desulfovibrio desulfuricans]|nr:carboxypeptidase M32 [Desulfovibrio desulfuricans]
MSAIFSTIHEYGLAQYGLQVKEAYEGTSLFSEIGTAMHESQSRFMENHIGRNRAFWEVNYPKLQKHFPKQL